jgi:hypothetical protein
VPIIPRASKRKRLLAAPIVVTAMFAPACQGVTHTNPRQPQEPERVQPTATATVAAPEASAEPNREPVPTASASAAAKAAALQDPPPNGEGRVVRQPDGTCLYVFPDPQKECPRDVDCNPGPPREPLRVKCPHGKGP